MKRDMDLCRKILFKIEELYIDTALLNLQLENYDNLQIAYHCKILYEAGLIDSYNAHYADNTLYLEKILHGIKSRRKLKTKLCLLHWKLLKP